jgi:hypothetical protein
MKKTKRYLDYLSEIFLVFKDLKRRTRFHPRGLSKNNSNPDFGLIVKKYKER